MEIIWNNSSFVYLANSTPGFNQSHYYQYQKNTYQNLVLGTDRKFRYTPKTVNFVVKTAIYPSTNQAPDYSLSNEGTIEQSGFYTPFANNTEVLRFYIIDSVTSKAWVNTDNGTSGQFGSVRPVPLGTVKPGHYQFKITTLTERQNVMNFIDAIPSGNMIVMTNGPASPFTTFPADWKADTLTLGSGISLYHKLKNIGWGYIDSLKTHLPFVFITKKGTNAPLNQTFGITPDEKLAVQFSTTGVNLQGQYISDLLGPAKSWQNLHWRSNSVESTNTDDLTVQVIGVDVNGNNTTLATIKPAQDTSLSWINANTYPYLKLKMIAADSLQGTPTQLRYWRINAAMLPEGTVAPNIVYTMKDTVDQGEKIDFKLAFKNISQTGFDSTMKFNIVVTDKNNVRYPLNVPRGKVLIAGDTLVVSQQIDTKNLPGLNTLFVEVNPNNHQSEQYHFNNILYKDFFVKADTYNPLLDVTFDGVHILDKDIVAAKPHIVINLKDESRFLALADTALLNVQVRFPDGSLHDYHFGSEMIFTPAI
ncbi:MAG: hypothetical protein IPP48_01180 [Chitinophagaceae bacterium]|nr:hypothetical protein [Chitinophagaceae bacterium]